MRATTPDQPPNITLDVRRTAATTSITLGTVFDASWLGGVTNTEQHQREPYRRHSRQRIDTRRGLGDDLEVLGQRSNLGIDGRHVPPGILDGASGIVPTVSSEADLPSMLTVMVGVRNSRIVR